MIHIRITRDNDDVTAVPPELSHFFTTHWQKWRHAQARSPELAIAVQRLGVAGEEGNIGVGSHINIGSHIRYEAAPLSLS